MLRLATRTPRSLITQVHSFTRRTMSSSASGSSPDAIIAALQPYTTCDISDALLKLKYRNGGFLAGPTMWSPQRQEGDTKIIGPAYTIKYALNEDPAPKMSGHYVCTPCVVGRPADALRRLMRYPRARFCSSRVRRMCPMPPMGD